MSFLDDLGNALGAIGSTGASAVNMAYDLALTPLGDTDKEDLADSWRDMTGKGGQILSNVASVPGIQQIAEAQYAAYTNLVSRPITTAQLFAGGPDHVQGDITAAWNASRDVSPAQAIAGTMSLPGATGLLVDKALEPIKDSAYEHNLFGEAGRDFIDKYVPWAKPDFDVTNPEQRKAAFEDNAVGKVVTGTGDAAISFFGDPFSIAGRLGSTSVRRRMRQQAPADDGGLARLATEADDHSRFLQTNGAEGSKTGFGQFIEDTTKMNSAQLLNDARVQSSSRPELLAGLLGHSDDFETNSLVVRAAAGDEWARKTLRSTDTALWDSIETAKSGLNESQVKLLNAVNQEDAVKVLEDGSFEFNPGWLDQNADQVELLGDLSKIYDQTVATNPWLSQAVELADSGRVMTDLGWRSPRLQSMTTKHTLSRAERRLNTHEIDGSFVQRAGWSVREFVAHPFARPVRLIAHFGDESPAGWVNVRGVSANGSAREIQAALAKVGWTGEQGAGRRAYWVDQYLQTSSSSERIGTLIAMERDVLNDLAQRHLPDLTPDEIGSFVDELHLQHRRLRSTAEQYAGSRGFLVDDDGAIVKAPVLESQLGQMVPMADFGMYEDLFRRHGSTMARYTGRAKDLLNDFYDIFSAIWRPMTLLRLGYTQRNVTESNLRAMAYFQGGMNVDPWASTAARFGRNMGLRSERGVYALGHRVTELPFFRTETKLRNSLKDLRSRKSAYQRELNDMVEDEQIFDNVVPRAQGPASVLPEEHYSLESAQTLGPGELASLNGNPRDVARLLGAKRREGMRLGYENAEGGMVFPKRLKDIPDDVLAQNRVMFWPDHRQAVKEALERGERVPPGVYEAYPRLKTANPEDTTHMQFSQTLAEQRAEIQARMMELDQAAETVRLNLDWRASNQRRRGRTTPPSHAADRGGRGTFNVDGQEVRDAFADENALVWSSGAPRTAQELAGPGSFAQRRLDSRAAWTEVRPGQKHYWDSLSRVVNQQVRNSPIASRILQGESLEDLGRWARTTREGKQWTRSFGLADEGIDARLGEIAESLERYVPSPRLRARLANGDTITAKELRNELEGLDDLSPIHGPSTARQLGGADWAANTWQSAMRKGFKYLGNIPEDVAARHPFYRKVYQDEFRAQAKLLKSQTGRKHLDWDEQRRLERASHARALKELQGTLYTIERYSNAASVLRFFMPFFASWENSMRVWTRLSGKDWSIPWKGMLIWQSPNRAGMAYDAEGNKLGVGEGSGRDTFIPVQLPRIGPEDGWYNQAVSSMSKLGLPKQSFNLIFQGEPWFNPGVGPVVQVPASEIVKRHPEFGEFAREAGILPFGPSRSAGSVDLFFPPWVKKMYYRFREEDSTEYMNTMTGISLYEWGRYNRGERDTAPTDEEIESRTKKFFIVRAVANLTLPVAPTFDSPIQYYFDEYRRLQREDPSTANERFMELYPEHYEVMTSMSKNVTGMQASVPAYQRAKKYSGLVSNISNIDPSLIALVTNTGEDYEFDQSVYAWMFANRVGPGSDTHFRESQSPDEARVAAEENAGWTQYMAISDRVDAIMVQRGLTSLNQSGAEDLAELKRKAIETIGDQYPGWYYDYKSRDEARSAKTVEALETIVSDQKFMADNGDNPMWAYVAMYLDAREKVRGILEQRRLAGGSSTIDAEANADVAQIWTGITSYMSAQNTDFANLYARWLETDDLGMVPSGG